MRSRPDVLRLWSAFALLGAGLVHLAVVSEHVEESALHGLFFLVVGAVQLGWGVLAMARTTLPAPHALVAVQVGLVAIWAASRTVGLPVPPAPWTTEPVGTADLLAVAAAGALLVWVLTTPALAATEAGQHAHPHGEPAKHGGTGH